MVRNSFHRFFPMFTMRVYQNFRGSSSLCSMAMAAMAGGWSDSKLPEAQSPRSVRTPSQGCGSLRVLGEFHKQTNEISNGKGWNRERFQSRMESRNQSETHHDSWYFILIFQHISSWYSRYSMIYFIIFHHDHIHHIRPRRGFKMFKLSQKWDDFNMISSFFRDFPGGSTWINNLRFPMDFFHKDPPHFFAMFVRKIPWIIGIPWKTVHLSMV